MSTQQGQSTSHLEGVLRLAAQVQRRAPRVQMRMLSGRPHRLAVQRADGGLLPRPVQRPWRVPARLLQVPRRMVGPPRRMASALPLILPPPPKTPSPSPRTIPNGHRPPPHPHEAWAQGDSAAHISHFLALLPSPHVRGTAPCCMFRYGNDCSRKQAGLPIEPGGPSAGFEARGAYPSSHVTCNSACAPAATCNSSCGTPCCAPQGTSGAAGHGCSRSCATGSPTTAHAPPPACARSCSCTTCCPSSALTCCSTGESRGHPLIRWIHRACF